jgi:hypothetical protein
MQGIGAEARGRVKQAKGKESLLDPYLLSISEKEGRHGGLSR